MTHACVEIAAMSSAVLAAAAARGPRKRPTPSPHVARNNYIAERRPPGAKPGNRNAWRHGVFSRARRERRAAMRVWFESQDAMMAAARLLARFPGHPTAQGLFDSRYRTAQALGQRYQALTRKAVLTPGFITYNVCVQRTRHHA